MQPEQPAPSLQLALNDVEEIAHCVGVGGVFYPYAGDAPPAPTGAEVTLEFVKPDGEVVSRISCRVRDAAMTIQGRLGMSLEVLALDPAARAVLEPAAQPSTGAAESGGAHAAADDRQRVDTLDGFFSGDGDGLVVGIDLGTTNSCVACVVDGEPRVLTTPQGYETMPSVIYLTEDHKVMVGHRAREKMALEPERAVYGSKRFIGRPFTANEVKTYGHFFRWGLAPDRRGQVAAKIGETVISLEVVAASILKMIKRMAETSLGQTINRAVITVPAYFGENQRQAVREAGRLAGLQVERVLNEPTAGAVAFGYGKGLSSTILVYDLGGGTFDASVLRVDGDRMEVLATDGGPFLGGSDFDDRLTEHLFAIIEKEQGVDLRQDAVVAQRLRSAAEKAKVELSESDGVPVELPFLFANEGQQVSVSLTVGRQILDTLTHDLVDRTLVIVQSVLDDAKVTAAELDDVIMIGGQSRSPLIRQMLAERFGKQPTRKVHPDHAVALGAAIVGGATYDKVEIELTDVLPASIRVGTPGGGTVVLLPRGHSLPIFKEVEIEGPTLALYRGEAEAAAENEPVGTIDLAALSGGDAPTVMLIVNAEGLMTVTAEDAATGKEVELEVSLLGHRSVQKPSESDSFFSM